MVPTQSPYPFEVFLETERLLLRRFTPEDAPLLVSLDSDPEVMLYISKGDPTPLEVIRKQILPRWMRYYDQCDHWGFWATHEKRSGDFIGWFHFRPFQPVPEEMELGYRLQRNTWGQGFATEGSRALIDKAFSVWNVGRVVATTLLDNKASQRVMEKCGLKLEKSYTLPIELRPSWTEAERQAVKYSITNNDYFSHAFTIRDARLDDVPAISALIHDLVASFILPDINDPAVAEFLEGISPDAIAGYLQSNYRYYVAMHHDRLVGVVGIRDNTHLYHLFVAASHHRQGLAARLWHHARSACAALGNPGPYTVNSSLHAVGFYERMGFSQTAPAFTRSGVTSIPMQYLASF